MRVQWLGDRSGAEHTFCFGMEFHKGKPVDIDDEALLAKAKDNPTFKVEDRPRKRAAPRKTKHRKH